MKFNKSILLYPFVLAPILAIFVTMFLNNGFYNLLSAITWLGVLLVIFDKLGKHQRIEFPKYLKYLLIFVLYTIISDYFLADKTINIKYIYSNYLLSGFLAALMVENIKYSSVFIKRASFISIIILFFAFVVILYQQFVDDFFLVNRESLSAVKGLTNIDNIQKRIPSIYSWSSLQDVGMGFIGIITLLISKYLIDKKNNFYILSLIMITQIYAFLTRGRSDMINAFLLVFLLLIYRGANIKNVIIYGLISLFVFIAAIQILEFINVPVEKIINERILESDKGNLNKTSAGTRIFAFVVFAKLFPEHPVFGKGMMHTFDKNDRDIELHRALGGRSSQIHVGYLSLLYYYGIVGAFPWLMFLFTLLKKLYLEAKLTKFYGGFFVFFGFMLANWTLINFTIFYYGLILALVFHNYYYKKQQAEYKYLTIREH